MDEQALVQQRALAASQQPSQYLTFAVCGQPMAIGILDVQEVIEVDALTRVPMMDNNVRGVINLRGHVIPVVDLCFRLYHQFTELTNRSCAVLVKVYSEDEWQTMGMLVNEVNEMMEIPHKDIARTPDFGTDIDNAFIAGMGRVDKRCIILLDIEQMLSVNDLSRTVMAEPVADASVEDVAVTLQ